MAEPDSSVHLARTVTWKQGMFIALGVPLLILPSLYDVSTILWGMCILIWVLSVVQGFIQNIAYGEMVTAFPDATGLPGCAQEVLAHPEKKKKYDKGRLLGAFGAWCYWFGWCPVVAIFIMMIGDYLIQMFSLDLTGWAAVGLYAAVAVCCVGLMYVLGTRGLEGGAKVGTVLALLSIIPIVIILLGAVLTGMFDVANITENWTSPDWTWSPVDVLLVFGCFGLAQWSGCAWETAAVYGPEYKDPGKDVPKALFACGFICLFMYFFVSTVVYGSLGQDGIEEAGIATLVPIAEYAFGELGGYIALFFLIVAMILIIQTGFLGSSRTLHSMAWEGNMPGWFGKVNEHGMPSNAMLFVSVFNVLLVVLVEISGFVFNLSTTTVTVLTASAIGYDLAHFFAMAAFVQSRRDPRFADRDRPFKAPKCWHWVMAALCVLQIGVFIPCLMYWSYYSSGSILAVALGWIILLAYVPVWFYVEKKLYDGSHQEAAPEGPQPEAEHCEQHAEAESGTQAWH